MIQTARALERILSGWITLVIVCYRRHERHLLYCQRAAGFVPLVI
jgi:hypothetical protein